VERGNLEKLEQGTISQAPVVRKLCRSQRLDALVVSEIDYAPRSRIGWHRHELAGLALTVRGTSTETFTNIGVDRMDCGLLVRPAGERHWDSFGDHGATSFLIEVGAEWLNGVPGLAAILARPRFHMRGTITRLARQAYREWLLNDIASPIAIQALALEIAAHLIRENERRAGAQPPIWLKRVKQRLDDDFTRTPSLAELARTGDVHPTHLARHFRRHYRQTVGEYLRQRRVDAAMELLSQKKLPLTEVALESGFSSHGHLCTVFKRLTGMTPAEFRGARN
jgi:AraC family transcriptional regulator